VWNSHTYHVTDSDSLGHIPPVQIDNWSQEGLNNFRQNVQGEGIFNAPDLTVDLGVGFGSCLDDKFDIIATVRNNGSLGVAAGVEVTLYEGSNANGALVGTQVTTEPLLPGGFVQLSWTVPAPAETSTGFFVAIDGVDQGASFVTECDENNNTASTELVACPIEG
jgi:hypothetical protein